MDTQKEPVAEWAIWVDWEHRIISFREIEGYKKLVYPTRDAMLQFALDKCWVGFSIQ